MQGAKEEFGPRWWQISSQRWFAFLKNQEEQVFLVLTLVIGALVGMTVVAFIVLTERFGARIYPPGGSAWHRLLAPVVGSLTMGYLLFKYFPNARGSGVPQTKATLSMHGAAEFLLAQFSGNSFARRCRSRAASRSEAIRSSKFPSINW